MTGTGLGLVYPSTSALTLQRGRGRTAPGVAVGAMTSFWDLGILFAGPVGGLIAGQLGFAAAFGLSATATAACLLLTIAL